jgi:murein DD-endopeptidase MepM/ murein hydrolase activator NlpD
MKAFISSFPTKHKMAVIAVSILLLLLALLPSERAVASRQTEKVADQLPGLMVGKPYQLPLNLQVEPEVQDVESTFKKVTIKSGDSLATIFKALNVPQKTMLALSRSGSDAKPFTNLQVGKELVFEFDNNHYLLAIHYELNKISTLVANHIEQDTFTFSEERKETTVTPTYFEGEIRASFWHAASEAGLNDSLIMNFANVFAWDVDFALDIREGDKFYALVEQVYVDGEFVEYGEILAAEVVNQGDVYQAIRYTDGRYYTPEGDSMRKAFLRAPVNFKYISSNFNPRRYHPVQKRYKAHRGVDYAASTGTPVFAAGDGKVIKSGYDKYNGHHVFVEHGGGITTKYIHFSKRKVKRGERVKQGQVIGLVGATGLAAGPHLHYEFLVNGVHRNPRTVSLPKANPIDRKERDAFLAFAKQRLQQLDHNKQLLIAMN